MCIRPVVILAIGMVASTASSFGAELLSRDFDQLLDNYYVDSAMLSPVEAASNGDNDPRYDPFGLTQSAPAR